mgnify:CR=1 FL=1
MTSSPSVFMTASSGIWISEAARGVGSPPACSGADRMELCLSFHFFHKIEHILIAVVRAVPLAVFADETGTDQYLKHNSPSFNARRTEFQAPASTHSAAQMAGIITQVSYFSQSGCMIKAGSSHTFSCGSDPAFFLSFHKITLRLRDPIFVRFRADGDQ